MAFATLLVLALAGLAAAGAGWTWYQAQVNAPGPVVDAATDAEPTDPVVLIPRGASVGAIARQLETAGLITDERLFRWHARIRRVEGQFKAGEFALPRGGSLDAVMTALIEGRPVLHPVTVPEGLTSAMVAEIINAADVLTGDPVEAPPEGSLLPDTYMVTRGDTRAAVLARMQKAQADLLAELWPLRAEGLPLASPEAAVILASIVEKETGVASERPRVAAVFVNRLRVPMRLQSDPTIIYGISKGVPLGRGLRRSEIDAVTPYNTYQIDGLPPTPIANPGREAIAAVLNPPQSRELFFVADGTGGHTFSETYAEHNRAVQRWRQIEQGRAP